ncbi:MAG: nucleoside monophosphate kinase [Nitrospirae bacterium]|nr:nucleoside monophosphate kinase [Nitrospirota bacterium]
MGPAKAILLIGPTGSGKTPFGDYLEKEGMHGRRCVHFDFGSRLRSIAAGAIPPDAFAPSEVQFIRDVLENGLLLENEHFPIAEKIFRRFLVKKNFRQDDLLILNGLPRHRGQAKDLGRIADVAGLVVLECSAEVVHKRIRTNAGLDRTGRDDDGVAMIRSKLDIYLSRTAGLVDYYAGKGSRVCRMKVSESSTAESVYADFISFHGHCLKNFP